MSERSPHNELFVFAFSKLEVAREELHAVLPRNAVRHLRLDAMEIETHRFVEPDLSARFCDMLYRVPQRGGGDAFVWVLLEHQSSDDPMMGLRLLEYMIRAWTKLLREAGVRRLLLPPILPVVLAHDPAGWSAPRRFSELYAGPSAMLERVRSVVPDFEYVVDDLSSADDASIARRTTSPFMRLVLWSLRARGEVAVKNRWRWMEALQQLWRAGRTDEVHAVVRYNVRATNSRKPWVLAAARDADPELERSIMNIWDERIAEGEARGRVAAKAETLLKQIRLKFGAPNEDTVRRVEAAEVDALDRWVERILTADSLDALFAED